MNINLEQMLPTPKPLLGSFIFGIKGIYPLPLYRVDIMKGDTEIEIFFRVTKEYRIWVDEEGIGRIRILKNVNLKTIMDLVEQVYHQINKNKNKKRIVFYISKSIYSKMSDNSKAFLDFCRNNLDIELDIILIER